MKVYRFRILFLLLVLLLVSCNKKSRTIPAVRDGELDLNGFDFADVDPVDLNGNWEFYWNALYTPKDFADSRKPQLTGYCYVPGTWSEQQINSQYYPAFGYATYRMKIKFKDAHRFFSLKIFDASSAYKLYVNDELVASNGKVSTDLDSIQTQYLPVLHTFTKTTDELQIIVQVANNFHSKGGMWGKITFGTQDKVMQAHNNVYIYDIFLIGVIFILFIYHFWIYLFRKSDKSALGFALLCLNLFLRLIVTGERILYVVLPSFNVNLGLRLEYLTMACASFFGAFLYHHLFPQDSSKKVVRIISYLTVAESVVILFSPTVFYTSIVWIVQMLLIGKVFYVLYISIQSVRNKRLGAIPFLLSLIAMFVSLINDILYANLIIDSVSIVSYGFLIFILSQAYFLASRISFAFNTVEQLSLNLEQKVVERTVQLTEEKKKSDDLLRNILPDEVALELKQNGFAEAKHYDRVTVLFTDFVNFTGISERLTAEELVAEINICFNAFDEIIGNNGLEKIKTIGDAYMAVCGLPVPNEEHALRAVRAATEILDFVKKRKENGGMFDIRIGLHSGSAVAGIVGSKKFAYDIWGDTVNTAARMEQHSETGKINITGTTYELVKDDFVCDYRGELEAKGKGKIKMYFVEARMKPGSDNSGNSYIYAQTFKDMLLRPESKYILNKLEHELPSHLKYHTVGHTMDVYQRAIAIAEAENVDGHELELLAIAALYHDAGYLQQRENHEDLSCKMVREVLPGYGYDAADIEQICLIIMATKLPQNPNSLLEQIICDADLDYLGRDDFFETGKGLYEEMCTAGIVNDQMAWDRIQVKFLENHHFFTQTNIRLRNSKKQENLNILRLKTGI